MADYVINVAQAFIRGEPKKERGNELAVLPENTLVTEIGDKIGVWRNVRCTLVGATFSGYVSDRVLTRAGHAQVESVGGEGIPEVHWKEGRATNTRRSRANASPLGEAGMPIRKQSDAQDPSKLIEFVDWARVDSTAHKRWKPGGGLTYCNIYAYDYCYAAGVFLPRVWWKPDALRQLGEGHHVNVAYGQTVREMNANALHDWLLDYGSEFGWQRATTVDQLQSEANDGAVAVICAARKDARRSGHITVIVPETDSHNADRVGGVVSLPLQSQAGSRNLRYSTIGSAWWSASRFRSFVFYFNRQNSRHA